MYLQDKALETYVPPALLDMNYYTTSLDSYTSWSFESHRTQLKILAEPFAQENTLIAPADGCGVVASLGFPKVISGDISTSTFSNPAVQKESISETIDRGFKVDNAVFVLSYCWTFMSDYDKIRIQSSGRPFLILDSTRNDMKVEGSTHPFPGVWVKARKDIVDKIFKKQPPKEKASEEEKVEYTENLIKMFNNLGEKNLLYYYTQNKYIRYLQNMCPVKVGKINITAQGGVIPPGSIVLCATLQEALYAQRVCAEWYWAPGGERGEIQRYDHDFILKSVFSARKIYSFPYTNHIKSLTEASDSSRKHRWVVFLGSGGVRVYISFLVGHHIMRGSISEGAIDFNLRVSSSNDDECIACTPGVPVSIVKSVPRDGPSFSYTLAYVASRWEWSFHCIASPGDFFSSGFGLGPKTFREFLQGSQKCITKEALSMVSFKGSSIVYSQLAGFAAVNQYGRLRAADFKIIEFPDELNGEDTEEET